MSLHSMLDRIQRRCAKSKMGVKLALLLRNQCNCVVGYYLGESNHIEENGEAKFLRHIASRIHKFIDVGANVGDWTAFLLQNAPTTVEGILFEPSLSALEKLETRFHHHPQLHIENKAVADVIGILEFREEEDAGETSSLLAFPSDKLGKQRSVEVTTIDNIIDSFGLNDLDLLKIDTEGYDFHVIRGTQNHLAAHKIGIIQFEYNIYWAYAGSTITGAMAYLEKLGYKVFLLRSTGLHYFNRQRYGDFFRYSNFVAVAPSHLPWINDLIRPMV